MRVRRLKSSGTGTTIRKRGNVYYMFRNERRRIPIRLILALLLVFVCGVGTAVSFAQINSLQREIRLSQNALHAQRDTNRILEARAAEGYTDERISARARELGLAEPDPSQIIYFYAPRHSHVSITYDAAPFQENYFWQEIFAFFSGIMDRLFG